MVVDEEGDIVYIVRGESGIFWNCSRVCAGDKQRVDTPSGLSWKPICPGITDIDIGLWVQNSQCGLPGDAHTLRKIPREMEEKGRGELFDLKDLRRLRARYQERVHTQPGCTQSTNTPGSDRPATASSEASGV